MGKKKTPLLQKLRNVGGTMYVFPSAAEDIGLNLQSTTTGVAMSHFALLNIGNISIEKCKEYCAHELVITDGNEALAMSLQNYAMNFETHLINDDNYNYQKLETISEKVFWKWARHIGIFDPTKQDEIIENIYLDSAYNADSSVSQQDNTLIKCFGSIDAGNQLSTEFGMFNETYINIPTSWGAGPVYMKHSNSENFQLGKHYKVDINYLEGRKDENPYYSYTHGQDYPIMDSDEGYYKIDTQYDGFEILKDLNQIQTASRVKFNNEKITFGSFDDINIDIKNNLNVDQQFEFNTILLYYSVYDQDDLVKIPYATNLFGVIFLDGLKPNDNKLEETTYYIPTILKRKSTTTQFGNSYSFRVNLKTMSVYDNTDAIIQDNTTMSGVSAVEFSDAISNMNRAIDIMNSNLTTTLAIQDQYASILNYYDNFEDEVRDISTCLNAYMKGTRSSFIDTSVVYTNEIRTSESENSFNDNRIIIRSHKANRDDFGDVSYNDPVVTIQDEYVTIPFLHNTSTWLKQSYVVLDDDVISSGDVNKDINSLTISGDSYVQNCVQTINRAFSETGGFNIKLRMRNDELTGQYSRNELYIDPDSSIFTDEEHIYNLQCLLDASKNINYIAIIPYIIAELQRLNTIINSNLIDDIRILNSSDFYDVSNNGIFGID